MRQQYAELRAVNWQGQTYSERRASLEEALALKGASLSKEQKEQNRLKADLRHLREAQAGTHDGSISTARAEFLKLAQMKGVQDIEVLADGVKLTVFVRVEFEGKLYDFEDWSLILSPSVEMRANEGIFRGVRADCLRQHKPDNWHGGVRHDYPRYRYYGGGVPRFCFGDKFQNICEFVKSGRFVEAAMMAITCMNWVNEEDQFLIPEAFFTVREDVTTLYAQNVVGGRFNMSEALEVKCVAYGNLRNHGLVSKIDEDVAALEFRGREIAATIKRLGSEIAVLTEQLNKLGETAEKWATYLAEFDALMTLTGFTSVRVTSRGVELALKVMVDTYNLGTFCLSLGPQYPRVHFAVVSDTGDVAPEYFGAQPTYWQRVNDDYYVFDFGYFRQDLRNLLDSGDILAAATLACERLHFIEPKHKAKLSKICKKRRHESNVEE
jgi:hypothetical protein